jgi:hypothetical protein
MGDGVIDDAQVIFELGPNGEYSAGNDTAKLILSSVQLTVDRPTNGYSGIGNETEVAVGYGTLSASMSTEQMVNREAAGMLVDLYENARTPQEVDVVATDTDAQGDSIVVLATSATKFDWNNLEVNYEDDGDATISVDGKIRGLSMRGVDSEQI